MAVSMRHTKLKAEEAALLAGEISKPSWESKNEGIHERISFEDSIWGFDLAGGSFYKTPLRVTYVKPDSRAEKAGIRPGDKLLRINDIDTSTLSIYEAHEIIIESGIHLRIAVTAPEDEEDAYYCYEDPLMDGYDSEEERRREEERARKRRVHAKVSSFWSLAWPWTSNKKPIYRESNCFMVNSKYEEARREKYPPIPTLRWTDDVIHFAEDANKKQIPSLYEVKENTRKARQEKLSHSETTSNHSEQHDELVNHKAEEPVNDRETVPAIVENGDENKEKQIENEIPSKQETDEENSVVEDENITENQNGLSPETMEESSSEIEPDSKETIDTEEMEEINGEVNPDELINEVLGKTDNIPKGEEDNILDSILSDEGQSLESSEDNER